MKLYDITERYMNLQSMLDEETTPKEDLIAAMEEISETDLTDKIESMCKMLRNIDADSEGLKAEITRLQDRKKAKENSKLQIKEYMYQQLLTMNIKKLKTPLFSLGIQFNPPSVNVIDESIIPKKYFIKQLPVLDKKELLADLKANIKVKGCEIKQSEGLRIR